ncbi:hypothetical protein PG988_000814 [Apiospora saccharicola]
MLSLRKPRQLAMPISMSFSQYGLMLQKPIANHGVDEGDGAVTAAAVVEALGEEKARVELVAGAEEGLLMRLAERDIEEDPDLIIWSGNVPVALSPVECVKGVFAVGNIFETKSLLALLAGKLSAWELGGWVAALSDSLQSSPGEDEDENVINGVTVIDTAAVENPCESSRVSEDEGILIAVPLMLPIIVVPKLDDVEEVRLSELLKIGSEFVVVCVEDDFAFVVLRKGATVMLDLWLVEVLRKRMALVDSSVVAGTPELDACPTIEEMGNVVGDSGVSVRPPLEEKILVADYYQ